MFNRGDIVKVKADCTIGELVTSKWNLARKDTLKFFEQYHKELRNADTTFTVKDVSERGNVVIVGKDGTNLFVNCNVLEKVKGATQRMTLDEMIAVVKQALGHDVELEDEEAYDGEDYDY